LIKIVLWKELRDLGRDRRTLFAIILLPLVSLPLLGAVTLVMTRKQPIGFAFVNEDKTGFSNTFLTQLRVWIEAYSKAYGQSYRIILLNNMTEAMKRIDIDYVIIIPKGFSDNLTRIDRIAWLMGEKRVDSARADMAEAIFRSSIDGLSRDYARNRVSNLLEKLGLNISPEVVLKPLRIQIREYKTGGAPAPPGYQARFYTVRILAFALFFVVSPSVSYVVDSIMGEKERKTIEALLATPVKRSSLLGGKLVASSLIGVLAGIADVAGVLIYFALMGWAYGSSQISLDYRIVLVHSLDIALTVFATSAMVTPLIIRAGSVRAANITSSAVVGAALILFFSVLFIDVNRLPSYILYPLYIVPYTHSILILTRFVEGNMILMLAHIGSLLALIAVLYYVSFKTFNTEKLLLPPTTTVSKKT
jgi:ABC-2 type transport system permease protein